VGLRGKALYTSNSPDAQAELPTKAAGQPISWQDLAKTDGGEAQPAAGWNLTEILNEIVPVNTVHNAQLASQLKQQIEHLELQLENLQLKERVAELEKQLGTAKGPEPAPPQTAAESNDADAPQ
jgi:ABC-type phosphate transport system auxiliary subunit